MVLPRNVTRLVLVAVALGIAGQAGGQVNVRPVPNPSLAPVRFGSAVAGIPDVDQDCIPDVAIGSPGAGRVFILSGADRHVIRSLTDPDLAVDQHFGFAVARLGDLDGDGLDDLGVGAPGTLTGVPPLPCSYSGVCPPYPDAGAAYAFSSADATVDDLRQLVDRRAGRARPLRRR